MEGVNDSRDATPARMAALRRAERTAVTIAVLTAVVLATGVGPVRTA